MCKAAKIKLKAAWLQESTVVSVFEHFELLLLFLICYLEVWLQQITPAS